MTMSRGVKDLREMVVLSRLTCRDSDSESDDGRAGMITPFQSLEITQKYKDSQTPTPPSSADSGLGRQRKKCKKPKGYVASTTKGQVTSISKSLVQPAEPFVFSKGRPLPAVGETHHMLNGGGVASSSSGDSLQSSPDVVQTRTDLSDLITYIDEETVADWLERANYNLKELSAWCTDTNFVKFAQFWITEFGVERRCEILALEHSILLDELMVAFRVGLQANKVQSRDITDILSALLREYPKKLTTSAGVYLFLDYLDTFTSERALEYRTILSDVKLSTRNKEHIQLILASRSFMLINVWVAIIDFYKQVTETPIISTEHLTSHRDKTDINYSRLIEAINLGYTEVVHYFLYSGKISAGYVNTRQKTLLHIATAANQPKIVEYLLKKWTGCMDVNRPCDTGNSPLHVAVNLGGYNSVRLLLNMPDINVNIENSQCEGATPLHLAVLHGNTDIAKMLLKSNADPYRLMGSQTIIDIARDFDRQDILKVLLDSD